MTERSLHLRRVPNQKKKPARDRELVINAKVGKVMNPKIPVIWVLPAGRYNITKMVLESGKGKQLKWTLPVGKREIFITSLAVADFGTWRVDRRLVSHPKSKSKGKTKTKKEELFIRLFQEDSGIESKHVKGSKVIYPLVNGFHKQPKTVQKKKVQKKKVQKKKVKQSGGISNSRFSRLRQEESLTQKIQINWAIAASDKQSRDHINSIVQEYYSHYLRCYRNFLVDHDTSSGNIKFRFAIKKGTGKMNKVELLEFMRKGSSLAKCIELELRGMLFKVNKDVSGNVAYTFKVSY